MNNQSDVKSRFRFHFDSWIFIPIALAFLCWSVWIALQMRPVQDDYGIAAYTVQLGVLGSTWDMFQTWNGGLFGQLVLHAYILLIAIFPGAWGYVPWVITINALAITLFFAMWKLCIKGASLTKVASLASISFVAFQLLILGFGRENNFTDFYVLSGWISGANRFLFSELALLVILRYCSSGKIFKKPYFVAGVAVGFTLGLWNLVEAAMIFSASGLIILASFLFQFKFRFSVREQLGVVVGALSAGALNYFSPGNQLRSAVIPKPSFGELVSAVGSNTVQVSNAVFGNVGNFLALFFSVSAITILLFSARKPIPVKTATVPYATPVIARSAVNRVLLAVTVFLVCGIVSVVAGASFSYYGFWHTYGLFLPVTVVISLISLKLANAFVGRSIHHAVTRIIAAVIVVSLLGLLIVDMKRFSTQAVNRASTWDQGLSLIHI